VIARLVIVFGVATVASACAGLDFGSDEGCAAACATASVCGLLPSALGYGASEAESIADCVRLCSDSPRDDHAGSILGCLLGTSTFEGDSSGWCANPEDSNYATGTSCSAAVACLSSAYGDTQVLPEIELEVALITLSDFDATFGKGAAAALYLGVGEAVQSCTTALCGRSSCEQKGGDIDGLACDDAMCRKEPLRIRETCAELAARVIDLAVIQADVPPANQGLLDESTAFTCDVSSAVFTSAQYHLRPGPVRAFADVAGILTAAELGLLGYPTGDAADDAELEYCLRFAGMNMNARGGDNLLLVPIGDIDDVTAHLTPYGVTVPPCAQ